LKTKLIKWIQKDYNPFIVFDSKGKIVYLNDEAEYLLGFVDYKEIFEFTIQNAKDKEIFTSFGEYKFDKFEFGAVSIGYEDDEIAIKLYKTLSFPKTQKIKELEKINLFFIVDFCRNYVFLDKEVELIDEFDVDIPEFFTNKKELIDILNKVFSQFQNKVKTTIKFEIGETLKVNNQKYGVIGIKIEGEKKSVNIDSKFFTIIENKNFYEILIPFIKHL
jgi:nitrogen-specific signal transduction histidine kinase